MRILSAGVLLVAALLATATPVPPETERQQIERLYGKIEDPTRDTKFELIGDKLKMTLRGGRRYDYYEEQERLGLPPAGARTYDDGKEIKTSPLLLREMKGDFAATVRAKVVLAEKAEAAANSTAEAGAGLMVLEKNGRPWRLGFHDFRTPERLQLITYPGLRGSAGIGGISFPDEGVLTRFTRKGKSVTLEIHDGKQWSTRISIGLNGELQEPLRVGVYAASNAKADTTVYLDQFRIEPLKDAKDAGK